MFPENWLWLGLRLSTRNIHGPRVHMVTLHMMTNDISHHLPLSHCLCPFSRGFRVPCSHIVVRSKFKHQSQANLILPRYGGRGLCGFGANRTVCAKLSGPFQISESKTQATDYVSHQWTSEAKSQPQLTAAYFFGFLLLSVRIRPWASDIDPNQ